VSQVRATYTIDDFVLAGRRPTDQSARELRYDLDAEHAVGDATILKFTGRASELRLGRFLNDSFSEIPFDSLRTTSMWARLEIGGAVQAQLGYRTLIRSDYDRALRVDYQSDANSIIRPGRRKISQAGPTGSLMWRMPGGSFLRFEGWAMVQKITYKLYGELPEEDADAIRAAASDGRKTLIPNLTVTMRWNF
jgi:hypothetical protein